MELNEALRCMLISINIILSEKARASVVKEI
jgi:hypothetical protein